MTIERSLPGTPVSTNGPATGGPDSPTPSGSHPAGERVSSDIERLIDFCVWELRYGDLPADVAEAALRVTAGRTRPARYPVDRQVRMTEGPLSVDGAEAGESDRFERRRCFPHQLGPVVRALLDDGCAYVLVQDTQSS